MKEQEKQSKIYWTVVDKDNPKLWEPSEHDMYDYIWATEEEAREQCDEDEIPAKIKVTLL
jgi:hypothetical protein